MTFAFVRRRVTVFLIATVGWSLLADARIVVAADGAATDAPQGVRVFTCGHSFHFFVPTMLPEIVKSAGIQGHVQIGTSAIGGSPVYKHWNVPDDKNDAKKELKAGAVDVLTLSPVHLPDSGIEDFVRLGLEHNPKLRVYVQENWLPFDLYDVTFTQRPKTVDHNAATVDFLRKLHEPYYASLDEHIRSLRKKYGEASVFVTPVGQAVNALRAKVIAGEVPGIKEQKQLFSDALGHPHPPLMVLNAYCHYAVIYRRSPVGLPAPLLLRFAKLGDNTEPLNRLLQEVAWEAVTSHPLSGVTK